MVSGKEHHRLATIKQWVAEINKLEAEHSYEQCRQYAPGRCPICLRIRMIELEQIEREIAVIEEDVAEIVGQMEPNSQAVEEAIGLLAYDPYRAAGAQAWAGYHPGEPAQR